MGAGVAAALMGLGASLIMVYGLFRLLAGLIPSFAASLVASAQAMGLASTMAFGFFTNIRMLLLASLPLVTTLLLFSTVLRDLPPRIKAVITVLAFLTSAVIMLRGAVISLLASIGPIGWVLLAVGAVVATFWDQIVGGVQAFAEAIGLVESKEEKFLRRLRKTRETLEEVTEAWREAAKAREEYVKMRGMWEEATRAGEATADLYEKLREARSEWTEAEAHALDVTYDYLNSLSEPDKAIDKYIKLLLEQLDLQTKQLDLGKREEELTEELEKAQDEYNKAVETYGVESEEAATALDNLESISEDLSKVLSEQAEIAEDLDEINDDLGESYDNLADYQKIAADNAKAVVGLLYEYIKVTTEIEEIESRINALRLVSAKYDTILKNKLAALAEAEEKLLDIEERLYNLRKSFVDKTRELWDALTKEGIVTDKMIEGRKALEMAYGRMMKAQVAFSSV